MQYATKHGDHVQMGNKNPTKQKHTQQKNL